MYDIDCSGTEDEVSAREAEKAAERAVPWMSMPVAYAIAPLVRIVLAFVAALGGGSVVAAMNRAKSPVWSWVKDIAAAVGMPDASLGDVLTEVRRIKAETDAVGSALDDADDPADGTTLAKRVARAIGQRAAELLARVEDVARVARESDATVASLRAQIAALSGVAPGASAAIDPVKLWVDYHTERPGCDSSHRLAFLAGVDAGRQTTARPAPSDDAARADLRALFVRLLDVDHAARHLSEDAGDDGTSGERVVTVDPDDFDALQTALDAIDPREGHDGEDRARHLEMFDAALAARPAPLTEAEDMLTITVPFDAEPTDMRDGWAAMNASNVVVAKGGRLLRVSAPDLQEAILAASRGAIPPEVRAAGVARADAEAMEFAASLAAGPPEVRPVSKRGECPGPHCVMCSGEACALCGAGTRSRGPDAPRCDHDVLERHRDGDIPPDRPDAGHARCGPRLLPPDVEDGRDGGCLRAASPEPREGGAKPMTLRGRRKRHRRLQKAAWRRVVTLALDLDTTGFRETARVAGATPGVSFVTLER